MSIGNPKKFKSFDSLEKALNTDERLEKEADSARVHKNKDYRIKRDLSFSTKQNKPKLT